MNTKILGLSGRKQSGKNTAANYIIGLYMLGMHIVRGHMEITPKGQLHVSDIFGDKEFEGVFDVYRQNEQMKTFLADNINQYIKLYSFADLLKQNVCMQVLGLSYEQCYGTDQQKDSLTHLKWQDMPGVVGKFNKLDSLTDDMRRDIFIDDNGLIRIFGVNLNLYQHEHGLMSGREVMQYVGTDIFRKMYSKVWVDATIKQIEKDGSYLALVCDCRFPDEVTGIQNAGGKVIRFTRNPHGEDTHESETALDKDNFDWAKFDTVIDNANMNIGQQNEAVQQILEPWDYVPRLDN